MSTETVGRKREIKERFKELRHNKKFGLFVILLIETLFLGVTNSSFLSTGNIINVLRQISVNGIVAVGMTFVIITGGIDISAGFMLSVAGVIAGSVLQIDPGLWFLAIVAALAVCGLFGLINGILIGFFEVPAFIATMSIQVICRGFALLYSDGRPYPISSPQFLALGKGTVWMIPVPVIIMLITCLIGAVVLNCTSYGRHIFALGGNKVAARASGVSTRAVETSVYVISAMTAALAGCVLAARISTGHPSTGEGLEMDAIAATVVGGTSFSGGLGTISGMMIGALILGILNNGLNLLNVSSNYQYIARGIIIATAVLLDIRTKKRSK